MMGGGKENDEKEGSGMTCLQQAGGIGDAGSLRFDRLRVNFKLRVTLRQAQSERDI